MNWTTERPVVAGYYWAVLHGSGEVILVEYDFVELVTVPPDEREGTEWVFHMGGDEVGKVEDFAWWMGPLEEPGRPGV